MAELIKAIAALLWPLLVLALVIIFRQTLHRILDSMERREIEIDVGGQKLTLRQLNDQQSKLIQDLQRQVTTLRKTQEREAGEIEQVEPPEPPVGETDAEPEQPAEVVPEQPKEPARRRPSAPPEPVPVEPQPLALLWVDDHPEENALFVEQLRENGVRVDIARSTDEGLDRLSHRQYRLIVSDMARQEQRGYHPDAGVTLIRELRDVGIETPVVIYCGQQSRQRYSDKALAAGAITVTDSPTQLLEYFQNFKLL